MLTFTHTYLLNLAHQQLSKKNLPSHKCELVLGNVIPDFVTHLGREKYQAIAHHLEAYDKLPHRKSLEWGAIFHILCDNYTTLGRLDFEGNYQNFPRSGFIETLSQNVQINIPLQIPKRRVLQCAFDILVLRDQRELLIELLTSAEAYLQENFLTILKRIAAIYQINQHQLEVGFNRFSQIYNSDVISQTATENYRLFPLIRNLLDLDSLTDPKLILQQIENHGELMEIIQINMKIVENNWRELLKDTVANILTYPGMREAI